MVMSHSDIYTLKETLQTQQQLLQRLYNELDAEREASSSAASEALSVILRLQGEKAAIKMESEQYKRLSEEKMCYAEESLEIIEDIIYQKEMEVAALNYQVQAYRHKLLSMGYTEPGVGDGVVVYSENLLQRNEALGSDKVVHSLSRRSSAPVLPKLKKFTTERDCKSPDADLFPNILEGESGEEINERNSGSEKKIDNSTSGSINSYWEQIKKLDERVLEIAGAGPKNESRSPSTLSSNPSVENLSKFGNETRPPSPQLTTINQCDPKRQAMGTDIDKNIRDPASLPKVGAAIDSPPNVYDVFEVPKVVQMFGSPEVPIKGQKKTACKGTEKTERESLVHPEAVRLYDNGEPDWLKKILQHVHSAEHSLCKPSNIAAMNCHLTVCQSSTSDSVSQTGSNQLNRTSEIIEVERPAEATYKEEEMKLLNEIKEQIALLQDEIRHWKVQESSIRDQPSLSSLSEDEIRNRKVKRSSTSAVTSLALYKRQCSTFGPHTEETLINLAVKTST